LKNRKLNKAAQREAPEFVFVAYKTIKSRRLRLAGHVAYMGVNKNAYKILVGKPEGKHHSDDLSIEERKCYDGS
jgi:hypothetical protein